MDAWAIYNEQGKEACPKCHKREYIKVLDIDLTPAHKFLVTVKCSMCDFKFQYIRKDIVTPLPPEERPTGPILLESIKEKRGRKKIDKVIDPTKCQKHPSYRGIRKPRTECERCWEIYNENRKRKENNEVMV